MDAETIALIQRLAGENRLWGAERIRGELLKLGIRVAKRTIQKYLGAVRSQSPTGQTWSTFLKTHGQDIWACDFVLVVTLFFQTLCVFVIVQVGLRRVVDVNASARPTDERIAQQLRDATPFEETPKHLICDNDTKFGPAFEAAAKTCGLAVIQTPDEAPRANAICERLWGVYGASAWIRCWCSAISNWCACWSSTRGISTRRAPTKAWRSSTGLAPVGPGVRGYWEQDHAMGVVPHTNPTHYPQTHGRACIERASSILCLGDLAWMPPDEACSQHRPVSRETTSGLGFDLRTD